MYHNISGLIITDFSPSSRLGGGEKIKGFGDGGVGNLKNKIWENIIFGSSKSLELISKTYFNSI